MATVFTLSGTFTRSLGTLPRLAIAPDHADKVAEWLFGSAYDPSGVQARFRGPLVPLPSMVGTPSVSARYTQADRTEGWDLGVTETAALTLLAVTAIVPSVTALQVPLGALTTDTNAGAWVGIDATYGYAAAYNVSGSLATAATGAGFGEPVFVAGATDAAGLSAWTASGGALSAESVDSTGTRTASGRDIKAHVHGNAGVTAESRLYYAAVYDGRLTEAEVAAAYAAVRAFLATQGVSVR